MIDDDDGADESEEELRLCYGSRMMKIWFKRWWREKGRSRWWSKGWLIGMMRDHEETGGMGGIAGVYGCRVAD